MKYYHATLLANVPRILSEGLTLPIGRVTSGSRTEPRIYLYRRLRDAELHFPALYETGALPFRIPFAVFEVVLPRGWKVYGDIEYSGSVFVTRRVPPRFLRVVLRHSDDYSDYANVDWDVC